MAIGLIILLSITLLLFSVVTFFILFVIPRINASIQAEVDALEAEEEERWRAEQAARRRYKKARERKERVVSYSSYTQEIAEHDLRQLGLRAPASKQAVKDAYRICAKKYHPDVNPKGANIFMEINKSYTRLMKEVYCD